MDSDPLTSFYVFVKNLKDGKKKVVGNKVLWNIKEVSTGLWKRSKLSSIPSVTSFKDKLNAEKKNSSCAPSEFGVVDGKFMVKHFIIDLAENKQILMDNAKTSRPPDPKRLSTSDASVPLEYFLKYEERKDARSSKKDSLKPKAKGRHETNDILDRLKMKRKHSAQNARDAVVSSATPAKKSCGEGNNKDSEDQSGVVPPKLSKVDVCYKENGKDVDVVQLTNLSKQSSTVAELKTLIENLKKKISSVTDQRDQALAELEALRMRFDDVKAELAAAKAASQDHVSKTLLEEIASNVKKIPDKIIQSSCPITSKLGTLTFAFDLETEYQDFEVPEGKIYVGRGQVISLKDVLTIEDDEDAFNKRAELVFNLICTDGIENYSSTGHKNAKGSFKVIPEHVQKALKRILRCMTWHDGRKVTSADLKKFFRKHPGDVRRRGKPSTKRGGKKAPKDYKSERNFPPKNKRVSDEEDSDDDESVGKSGNEDFDKSFEIEENDLGNMGSDSEDKNNVDDLLPPLMKNRDSIDPFEGM